MPQIWMTYDELAVLCGVELIEENGGGLGARLKRRLELIDENGGGRGVRFRKSGKEKPGK